MCSFAFLLSVLLCRLALLLLALFILLLESKQEVWGRLERHRLEELAHLHKCVCITPHSLFKPAFPLLLLFNLIYLMC